MHRPTDPQVTFFEQDNARALLDQLLTDSRLYRTGKDYRELLDFVARLRNVAPFNAMLLQLQKPGLRFAASALDWSERFGRCIKEGARPLLILWPFGPVATVYDVQDTEGAALPEDVSSFVARGTIDEQRIRDFQRRLAKKHICCVDVDAGDGAAGSIRVVRRADPQNKKDRTEYRMQMNRNHSAPVRFVTLAHELAHLFLGHLGQDSALQVPSRPPLVLARRELEAESVAYVVAERNGVSSKSQTYLARFVEAETSIDDLDIYQIMRAAGQVETVIGVVSHTRFKAQRRPRDPLAV